MDKQDLDVNVSKRALMFDHIHKTILVSESFARAAAKFGSNEFNCLMNMRKACPDYQIRCTAPKKQKKTRDRISYDRMRKYMRCLRNGEECLELFEKVVAYSCSQRAPYQCVADWFSRSFPDYGAAVDFDKDGYPIAEENIIFFDVYKKECEQKQKQEQAAV